MERKTVSRNPMAGNDKMIMLGRDVILGEQIKADVCCIPVFFTTGLDEDDEDEDGDGKSIEKRYMRIVSVKS